jgi:hypothetical protein
MLKNNQQNNEQNSPQTPDTLPKQNWIRRADNWMEKFENGTISKLIKLRELLARDVFQKTVKIQTEKPPSTLKVLGIVAASALLISPLAVDYPDLFNKNLAGKTLIPPALQKHIDLAREAQEDFRGIPREHKQPSETPNHNQPVLSKEKIAQQGIKPLPPTKLDNSKPVEH